MNVICYQHETACNGIIIGLQMDEIAILKTLLKYSHFAILCRYFQS